jgi:aspartyl-tRNA(Asn)/glutamyl-tRNA(Gln) amidotransferase subunit A
MASATARGVVLSPVSHAHDLLETSRSLRHGDVTSQALVRRALDASERFDSALGVFAERFDELALRAAERADAELAAGRDRGVLHGVPLSLKHVVSLESAAARRLLEAGAVLLGKTTAPAFALESWRHPVPRNPWDLSRSPGGSSAGSATGVAAGFFFGSVASDTGGSIRIPAAFNGATALKPTFGLVPRTGVSLLAPSCDTVGPIAGSARELWHLLSVLAGSDGIDSAADGARPLAPLRFESGELHGVRIGVDRLTRIGQPVQHAELQGQLERALDSLREAGAEVVDVEIPWFRELTIARIVTFAVEAAAAQGRKTRAELADLELSTRRLVSLGLTYRAADYVQAQRVRRAGRRALDAVFERVEYLLTPTTPGPAPHLDEPDEFGPHSRTDPRALNGYSGVWNALGNPALTLPLGVTREGAPLAFQVIGRPYDDAGVLGVGAAFQSRTAWHRRRPDLAVTVAPFLGTRPSTAHGSEPGTVDDGAARAGDRARSLLGPFAQRVSEAELAELEAVLDARRDDTERLHAVVEARREEFVPSLPA